MPRRESSQSAWRSSPSCVAQLDRRGFLREQRIGAGFDGEAVDVLGADQAAGARRGLEDLKRNAAACKLDTPAERPVMPAPTMTITSGVARSLDRERSSAGYVI